MAADDSFQRSRVPVRGRQPSQWDREELGRPIERVGAVTHAITHADR
jgi:hypothetical protein